MFGGAKPSYHTLEDKSLISHLIHTIFLYMLNLKTIMLPVRNLQSVVSCKKTYDVQLSQLAEMRACSSYVTA